MNHYRRLAAQAPILIHVFHAPLKTLASANSLRYQIAMTIQDRIDGFSPAAARGAAAAFLLSPLLLGLIGDRRVR